MGCSRNAFSRRLLSGEGGLDELASVDPIEAVRMKRHGRFFWVGLACLSRSNTNSSAADAETEASV